MITLENVTKIYANGVVALNEVNLSIKKGEFLTIIGQSGSGKSTLVRLLIAEERPTSGKIMVNDWNVDTIAPNRVPYFRRKIGVVFQDFKLLPKKMVYENIAFALEVSGEQRRFIDRQVPQVLKLVGLVQKHDQFPSQLSGGEQQRVAIARSLVHQPEILIADEPTGNLDAINSREIMELLLKINEFGTTTILVSHNRELVDFIKKKVVTIDKGEIVRSQEVGKYVL